MNEIIKINHEAYLSSIEEISFLDLVRIDTGSNTNHPQELVQIITAVANEATEYN